MGTFTPGFGCGCVEYALQAGNGLFPASLSRTYSPLSPSLPLSPSTPLCCLCVSVYFVCEEAVKYSRCRFTVFFCPDVMCAHADVDAVRLYGVNDDMREQLNGKSQRTVVSIRPPYVYFSLFFAFFCRACGGVLQEDVRRTVRLPLWHDQRHGK